ncbi:50S ribosomal protein L11 methyltransferase, partial [Serratia marcescens]
GVLASQASSVAQAYEEKFTLDPVAEREEWCRITGRRK